MAAKTDNFQSPDYFNVDELLTDEHKLVRESVRNYVKKEMVAFGYPRQSITVINNISEIENIKKLNRTKRNQITFAGRVESEKGIWTLVTAWEILAHPTLELLIIGDGSMLVQLKEYVSNKKISNIRFLGKLPNDQVLKHYLESKIIIAPSIWPEPFGRFILESIATKTPLITTRVGGIPEAVKNKQTGILIEPNDPYQLARSIKELLHNKFSNLQRI